MTRIATIRLNVLLGAGIITFLLAGCGGTSNAPLNMAGTWTVRTVSTQGHGNFSGTATVTQSGQGLGVNGSTTLAAAAIGQIAVSQTGTALTGTIANSIKAIAYNFTGTLSSGSFTVTGSTPCSTKATQSTSISGTITSNSMQGTYTISTGSSCYYSGDAGTFTATKQ